MMVSSTMKSSYCQESQLLTCDKAYKNSIIIYQHYKNCFLRKIKKKLSKSISLIELFNTFFACYPCNLYIYKDFLKRLVVIKEKDVEQSCSLITLDKGSSSHCKEFFFKPRLLTSQFLPHPGHDQWQQTINLRLSAFFPR